MASTQSISVSPFPPARRSAPPRYRLGPAWRSTSSSRLEATQGEPHRGHLPAFKMQALILGIGALDGTIAARGQTFVLDSAATLSIPVSPCERIRGKSI